MQGLISDIRTEQQLTAQRQALLHAAECNLVLNNSTLQTYCKLAQQCFNNEYIFVCSTDEMQRALQLQKQLNPLRIIALASYIPLHQVKLPAQIWPDYIQALIQQQINEPAYEQQLCHTIPCLTSIENAISCLVREQYEQNPYPRWITPYKSKLPPIALPAQPQILIAGCGTGLHPISISLQLEQAQILAIDLSLTSLAYAKRKTEQLALHNIQYAQAELLKLAELGRQFDVIESLGVLQHLADPWHGWCVLLSLLRPNGVMKLGLYSATARKPINQTRQRLQQQGHSNIKTCRAALIASNDYVTQHPDFYSTSTCQDLLFHVHEHCFTLDEIAQFIQQQQLEFLGFDLPNNILQHYLHQHPKDSTATDLTLWQQFEQQHPETFISLYQFWVRKKAS